MTVRDELNAINAGFSAALANQDAERVAAYYTDDARLLVPGSPTIRGHEAILATFREDLKGAPAPISFESGEVLEGSDLVVDIGHYVTPRSQSRYVVVYRRQPDGTLKIAVDTGLGPDPLPPTSTGTVDASAGRA